MRLATAIVLALAFAAPAAGAAIQDSTILVDRPALGGLPDDSINDSTNASPQSVSADGNLVVFVSKSDALLPDGADRTIDHVYVRDRAAQTTTMVDMTSAGVPGTTSASAPVISANGDRVAFVSGAANLTPSETIFNSNVLVKDLSDDTFTIASRRTTGAPEDAGVSAPVLDADGTTLAWVSPSMLDPDDDNGRSDVYKIEVASGLPVLQSRKDSATGDVILASAGAPAISANGNRVVFETDGQLEPTADANSVKDVYRRTGDLIVLISRIDGAGGGAGNGASTEPTITGDVVAFRSESTNLVADDTNGVSDIFVRDSGDTELISRPDGSTTDLGDGTSRRPAFNGMGTHVGFISKAGNLVTGVGAPAEFDERAFVRDLGSAATTTLASRQTGASGAPVEGQIVTVALDDDASVVVFGGNAAELGTPGYDAQALYARDAATTSLVSGPTGASSPPAAVDVVLAHSGRAMSDDGRWMVFWSTSDALSDADVDRHRNVYLRDNASGALTAITPGANGDSFNAVISGDGSRIAFVTTATSFGPARGVYVYDVAAQTYTLVSRRDGPSGAPAAFETMGYDPTLDADGSRAGFSTLESLDAADGNSGSQDYYVRDLAAQTTVLASRATGAGTAAGNGHSFFGALDGSGTKLAYMSYATDLGDGDTTADADIHLRDLEAQTTVLVSRRDGVGTPPGDDGSEVPSISADGNKVAFVSLAKDLDSPIDNPDNNGSTDIYVRDLVAGTTTLVSRAGAAGAAGNGGSTQAAISRDGTRVAFVTQATNLHPLLTGSARGVLARSLTAGENVLVSRADGAAGAAASITSSPPLLASLSVDGGCVGFITPATGMVPDGYPSPDYAHLYIRAVSGECPRPVPVVTPQPTPTATTVPTVEPTVTPTVTPDTTAPVISKVKVTRKRVSFALSEGASVRVTAHRGKKRKFKRMREFVAGENKLRFKPKLKKGGRYKVKLRATDAAGNQSSKSKRFPKR